MKLPLNIVLAIVLASTIRKEKEIEGPKTEKEKLNFQCFMGNIIIYIENQKESKKLFV